MQQIVKDYNVLIQPIESRLVPMGDSVSPKGMIFHILEDNSEAVDVLDIGFGTGSLGRMIKSSNETSHWSIDGIDGWDINCSNKNLFDENIYRNVWHGLAQELPSDIFSKYSIICLLDVIEHLDLNTAKWLMRTLLTSMGDDSFLFISTPLWFFPQNQQQDGDLEEHLIGVPATSMMALIPTMYSINSPLVGGFVYGKKSLNYVDFFHPTTNKNFTYEMGFNIVKSINLPIQPGIVYKMV
jgi:2-polyprenyl-3-methyl-5-hydroxy-6-metoxy-1,4-benzoquinol methylase